MLVYKEFNFINSCPSKSEWHLNWLATGKKLIYSNRSLKRIISWSRKIPQVIIPSNYRPRAGLPMMQKLITTQITKEIYHSLVYHGLSPEIQIRCHRGTKITGNLLYIDQHIFKEKCSYSTNWLQKDLWCYPPNLESKLSENAQEKCSYGINWPQKDLWCYPLNLESKLSENAPEKCSYGINWPQKDLWCYPPNLESKLSENAQEKCSYGINWLQKDLWCYPLNLESKLSEN